MKKVSEKNLALKFAYIFESLLSMVVLIVVFLGTIDVLRVIWHSYIIEYQTPVQYAQFNSLLGQILLLVIGIELVVMLSLHIPGALIEALLYAIARKIILLPKGEGMLEVLLGIIAIAGLFAIRKYLITDDNSTMNVTSIHYEECEDGDCECHKRNLEMTLENQNKQQIK
ncbi:phosphate-starvation-inducible PsiE family protein [Paraclostridium ghonii]|uniref:Transporter n=1 Tax=Paraclostridium ghonii TaxID=29358 RepID=A0ABU0N0G8_9FIRM|nr:phosphate-starvation-inducible PsiE family protein [Paeniclostridium ghonii]MCM0166169.1 phosphate-starvation-inducible PsiE family protein [Paeniclostridium ghonii]MDQ0556663.1 hypothetical protein [Paeniclostridium ghonii]